MPYIDGNQLISQKFVSINACLASKKAFSNTIGSVYKVHCCTSFPHSLACCSHEPESFADLFLHKRLEMHLPLCSNFVCIVSFSIYCPHLLSLNFMALHHEWRDPKIKQGWTRGFQKPCTDIGSEMEDLVLMSTQLT